jgi:hypothetical protein
MPLVPKDLRDPVVRCGICDEEYSIPIDGCPNQCYRQTQEIPPIDHGLQQTSVEDWHDRVTRVCPELDGTK